MNIAMISDTYLPQLNGVATSVHLFRKSLEKLGHKVFVVSPIGTKGDSDFLKVKGVPIFQGGEKFALPNLDKLTRFLEENNVTHIHSHSPFLLGWTSLRLQKKFGYVHFHTYHTLLVEYRHYIHRLIRPSKDLIKEFSKWFCNEVSCVIAPTLEIKSELQNYGVTNTIEIVPTGIDTELFENAPFIDIRKKYGLPQDSFLGLYAGRLAKEKNIDFLLDVVEQLVHKNHDFYFIIVGSGPHSEELKAIVQKKRLENRVVFVGALQRNVLASYYKFSDCLLFSSVTETQGLVVLEALAAGLPTIAVAQKGIKNVLVHGEGCALTETPDKDFFVHQTLRLLEDRTFRTQLSEKGKEYIRQNWSIEIFAKRVAALYQNYEKPEQYTAQKMFEVSELWRWIRTRLRRVEENIYDK